jgi:hypothetical protein
MDTAEVDIEQIEQQMSATRASIDRKLDALSARTAFARETGPWIIGGLLGISAALALWRYRRVNRHRRRVFVLR